MLFEDRCDVVRVDLWNDQFALQFVHDALRMLHWILIGYIDKKLLDEISHEDKGCATVRADLFEFSRHIGLGGAFDGYRSAAAWHDHGECRRDREWTDLKAALGRRISSERRESYSPGEDRRRTSR